MCSVFGFTSGQGIGFYIEILPSMFYHRGLFFYVKMIENNE